MVRRLTPLAGIAAALALIALALALFFSAYRRVETSIRLMGGATTVVQGVVLETLIEQRPDRLLPFDVRTCVVRYAYPNPQGQMRTGEQVVTRAFFDRVNGQGRPVWITYDTASPALSAVDPRLTFPASAGWRAGMGMAALVLAFALVNTSLAAARRSARA